MSRGLLALIALCCLLPRAADAAEFYEDDGLEATGDTLTVFLPLSAMVISFAKRDWPGSIQLAKSIVGTQITVETIKRVYLKARPNAASLMSFPSGHAAGGFSGAAFISQRYDFPWWVDTLYWGGAAWTAYTRVHAQKHHLDDVLMGGAVAVFMNWFFVRPQESKVALMPMATSAGYGLSLSWGGQALADPTEEPPGWERRFRLELGFGSAWQSRNDVTSPQATGTRIDFSDIGTTSNPQPSAQLSMEFFLDDGHEFMIRLTPFEARDLGSFQTPVSFAGTTYAANNAIRSGYLFYDLRVRWRVDVTDHDRWVVKVGFGMSWLNAAADLFDLTALTSSSVETNTVLPLAHLHVGFRASRKIGFYFEVDGMALGSSHLVDAVLGFRWQIDRHWDAGIAYRLIDHHQGDNPALRNTLTLHWPLFVFGYTW